MSEQANDLISALRFLNHPLTQRAADRIEELEAGMASIHKFAIQADDPEHHTLGLIKHVAAAASQSLSRHERQADDSVHKRQADDSVAPGTRAHCEGCGRPASYMVNSNLWRVKERDVCPLCEAKVYASRRCTNK